MLQKIVDPKIVLNSWKGKNWDVVNFYHKKYFQEENFLVFDENVEDIFRTLLEHEKLELPSSKRSSQEGKTDDPNYYP